MLVRKLHSGTSKTMQLAPVHLDLPLFWKSHCATCAPACVILYHVTGSCKGSIAVLLLCYCCVTTVLLLCYCCVSVVLLLCYCCVAVLLRQCVWYAPFTDMLRLCYYCDAAVTVVLLLHTTALILQYY